MVSSSSTAHAIATPAFVDSSVVGSECDFVPSTAAIGGAIEGLGLHLNWTAETLYGSQLSSMFTTLCSNQQFVQDDAQFGGPNLDLGLYGTSAQGLVYSNVSIDWVTWNGTVEYEHEESWSMNQSNATITGPIVTSNPAPPAYGSYSSSPNWAGYEMWPASNDPTVDEALADTQPMAMQADPGGQTLPADTGSVDSVAAVWVGLSPYSGGGEGNSASLLQTGYVLDATSPSDAWCAGFASSCDYGLWWEAINAGSYECLVNGAYLSICPPYPYNGNPKVHVGDLLQLAVADNTVSGQYSTIVYDSNTDQTWQNTIATGSWAPIYADYIMEAPVLTSGSFSGVAQIPVFSSETVDFENGLVCAGGNCLTLSQAYNDGYYAGYDMDQGITVNTNTQITSGLTYWGAAQSFPTVQWLSSLYDYCYEWDNPPHCQGGGGGGCVAYGTPILTPIGYLPVQSLRPGDPVEEFNFSSQSLTNGSFVSANTTQVSELINVDRGLLYLTPTDQPVFIRNSSFEGWLRDPQNLSTADQIFDPVTFSWIPVISVQLIQKNSVVFDVDTSGANNFVANGALLDKKT
jgi:hypothetical protein